MNWMLRLTPRGVQPPHQHGLCSAIIASSAKPKLVQLRCKLPCTSARAVLINRSFSSMIGELPSNGCRGAGTLDDVIARSKSSSDIQKKGFELPEVARIPTKKRTFHLHREELESLVRPLLSCHWHVGPIGDATDSLQVFSLDKLFSFKDFSSAIEFFGALVGIQNEEEHHARVTVDYAHVHVSTHTHIAYQHDSDANTDAKPIKVPGLTARDIRFAVKVEKLHEQFLSDERAITKVPADFASLEAWSMAQLRWRYPQAESHG